MLDIGRLTKTNFSRLAVKKKTLLIIPRFEQCCKEENQAQGKREGRDRPLCYLRVWGFKKSVRGSHVKLFLIYHTIVTNTAKIEGYSEDEDIFTSFEHPLTLELFVLYCCCFRSSLNVNIT